MEKDAAGCRALNRNFIVGDGIMPIEYPVEFKCKIIHRYKKGESIKTLSQELNIAQSTIYHGRKLYCSIQTPQRT